MLWVVLWWGVSTCAETYCLGAAGEVALAFEWEPPAPRGYPRPRRLHLVAAPYSGGEWLRDALLGAGVIERAHVDHWPFYNATRFGGAGGAPTADSDDPQKRRH